MDWVLLSLQWLPNDLESGFFADFAKVCRVPIWKEFYVHTQTLGNFIIQGQEEYLWKPLEPQIDHIEASLEWLRQRLTFHRTAKIILVIAAHGTGNSFRLTSTREVELVRIQDTICRSRSRPLIIVLDSCMMATIDVLRTLHNCAHYCIAMEDYCGWEGAMTPALGEILSTCPSATLSVLELQAVCRSWVDDMIRRAQKEKEGSTSVSLLDLRVSEDKLRVLAINSERCRIDRKSDEIHDYACVRGQTHPAVIYHRSLRPDLSGLAITTRKAV